MKLTIRAKELEIRCTLEEDQVDPLATQEQIDALVLQGRRIVRRLEILNLRLGAIATPHARPAVHPLTFEENQMAKITDAEALLEAMNQLTNELGEKVDIVVENEGAQIAEIQALKDQIAAGTPVSQEQLDSLVSTMEARKGALEAVRDHLATIASDPNDPTPAVPPIELGDEGDGESGSGEGGANRTL